MVEINAKEFIDELIFCLKKEDIVKAKALLQFASDSNVDPDVQRKALLELAKGPEKVVFPLLEYLTKKEISDPEIKDGLYDLILDKAYGNTDLVIDYITQNEKPTRLMFIRAAGDLLLTDAAPALIRVIQEEQDPELLDSAIQALGAFRLSHCIETVSPMSCHQNLGVRKAAIWAIAEIKGKKATDTLLGFLGDDEETDKFVVEALADMQEIYALEKLTALLGSSTTLVRDTAIDQLMGLGRKATPLLTRALQNAATDYLVHLITTLGYIRDPAAISAIRDIVNTQPKDANIRQAAYEAMARIPSPKTAISLAQGLQDPVEAVRMSAARAIDKNLSKPLIAGLKNIFREESQGSMLAVSAFIDTEAGNIFNFFMEDDSFKTLAKKHIVEKASPASRKTFFKNIISRGAKAFATDIAKEISGNGNQNRSETKIVVVDDSKMMLKLYQNKLSSLGFIPQTFHRPEDAIPAILSKKTDLVITDLNMPNISGLELTREIRKKFTRQDLPILMITTQSDFVEKESGDIDVNDTILKKSGINTLLHKPFSDDDFKKAIFQFLEPQ